VSCVKESVRDHSHGLRPPAAQDQAYAARPRMPCTLGGGVGGGGADGLTPVLSAPLKLSLRV